MDAKSLGTAVLLSTALWIGGQQATAQNTPSATTKAPPRTARQPARGDVQPASNNQPVAPRSTGQAPATRQPAAGASAPRTAQQLPRTDQMAQPTGKEQPGGRAVIKGVAPVAPKAPFTLTPSEQQLLDQILIKWEKQSDKVSSFACSFSRWEVDLTFGPPTNDYVLTEGKGQIKFKAPDHGTYLIDNLVEWDKQKKSYVPRTEGLDHWVCNGKSIFEFNAQKKQLIERQLAPDMQGKAISDGPLPFIFGAKADQLRRRYWMRDVTQKDEVGKQIWLEAWPKFQQDAANFQQAVVILNYRDFMPAGLRIILPDGKNKQDYAFEGTKINDPLSWIKGDFAEPRTPRGWEKVVEPAEGSTPPVVDRPAQAQRASATSKGAPAQAQRASAIRK